MTDQVRTPSGDDIPTRPPDAPTESDDEPTVDDHAETDPEDDDGA